MKISIVVLLVALAIVSCHREDDDPAAKAALDASPSWINASPLVRPGATSADLVFKTDREATIYYVVSEKEISLSAPLLVAESKSPTDPSIRFNGVTDVPAGTEILTSIEKLQEQKTYYAYFLAQSPGASSANDPIRDLRFKTQIRQDTVQFFSSAENREVDFLLYRPEHVFKNPNEKYPIIIFLGGLGEKATKSRRVNIIQNGLLPEYIYKGNDVPMLVMSIQHVYDDWNINLINEAIDYALAKLPVDKARVYLVGTSAGAFGVWGFAEEFADRIRAIVPISGGGDTQRACTLKNEAIWAFTNKFDHLVNPGKSINMVHAVNACAPVTPAKLNVFPDAGHDCWRRVFDKNHPDWKKSPQEQRVDIFQWLIDQK
jgi:hypothetical protein